jgi:hypothetical protein
MTRQQDAEAYAAGGYMRTPAALYGMYTEEGAAAVAQLIKRIKAFGKVNRQYVFGALLGLSMVFPEANDTVVRDHVFEALKGTVR